MRVAIAGAGAVGRAIAGVLLEDGHKVLLIERLRAKYRPDLVPDADWMLADACELQTLRTAEVQACDVVVAAAGDDKVNLVFALLCKRECAVPRVVARVNNPGNRWLFDGDWGVDVAVSTPSALASLVDEAVAVGSVVQLMALQQGHGNVFAITLPTGAGVIGLPVERLLARLPPDVAAVAVRRDSGLLPPAAGLRLEAGDELVLVAPADSQHLLRLAVLGVP